jgi:hypothetical protein
MCGHYLSLSRDGLVHLQVVLHLTHHPHLIEAVLEIDSIEFTCAVCGGGGVGLPGKGVAFFSYSSDCSFRICGMLPTILAFSHAGKASFAKYRFPYLGIRHKHWKNVSWNNGPDEYT